MKGTTGGENQSFNAQNTELSQLTGDSSQLFNQWNQLGLPALEQLYPELQATLSGGPSALMTAAEAPVMAQTNSLLNTIGQGQSGLVNPNALYENLAQTGGQNAALAADQTLNTAMSGLTDLIGDQSSLVSSGLSAGANAAGQYGQQGQFLGNQVDSQWSAILGALGTAAGAFTGPKGTSASTQSVTPGGNNTTFGVNPTAANAAGAYDGSIINPSVLNAFSSYGPTGQNSTPSSVLPTGPGMTPAGGGGGGFSWAGVPSF